MSEKESENESGRSMSKLHLFPRLQADHEDLFLARYERLLAFARQLRDVDAQRAEDLVHDAFVQFIVSRPPLDNIENLDGYLHRMVRNLHLSEIRRRTPVQSLLPEATEPETAALQLQALKDYASLAAVKAELRATCRYAIARKESSRAGSAFILRFFHGYYIHEIAQILRAEKQPVYDLLRIARREVRAFRESSDQLSFIVNVTEDAAALLLTETSEEGELVEHLCDSIFKSCRTDCLPVRQLRQRYREESKDSIDTQLAAHLVSCRRCLEVVNRTLGLRALEDRFPTDTLGPGASAGETKQPLSFKRKPAKRDWRSECRARADEIYYHEPEELFVSVNGFVIVRQTISGGVSEQTTSINLAEPIGFVEIFCEHGLRLAFFNVEPPTAGVREQQWQQWQIALSGGRTLELSLNFEHPWPQLHVCYQTLTEGGVRNAERGMEERRALPSVLFPADDDALPELSGLLARLKSTFSNPQSAIKWLLRPVTITALLTLVLIAVVVGQKLGFWLAPAKPASTPEQHAIPSDKPPLKRTTTAAPKTEPSIGNATAAPVALAPVATPSALLPTVLAQLEIEVMSLLAQSGGEVGEQVSVTRTPAGQLRIEGLLETEARKAAILRALAPLSANPAVQLEIKTIAEAVRQTNPAKAPQAVTAVREFAATENEIPAAAELRRHFAGEGEERVHQYARHMTEHATQTMLHAAELRRLARRFSTAELSALDAAARTRWQALLRARARSLANQLQRLGAELRPIFFTVSGSEATSELSDDAALLRAIEQLYDQCATVDRHVRAAFSIKTNVEPMGGAAKQIKTAHFWRALTTAEALATKIAAEKN
jgi:RNA polymerase sigma factor (sigma-70 family)